MRFGCSVAARTLLPPQVSPLRSDGIQCPTRRCLKEGIMYPRWTLIAPAIMSCLSAVCLATASAGDTYPVKPIRVLAGGAAGGPIDIMARVVGQKLSDQLGQSFIIDNRGGAGGTIATRMAAQGIPDGYTLLCNSSQYAAAASLYKNPGYDPFKDFAPIINAGVTPNMIFVRPSGSAKNLQAVIALGKRRKLSYGSAGAGTTPHLTGERLLKLMAGLEIPHIPYSN